MDIDLKEIAPPALTAQFVPIYWEPMPGSQERLASAVAFVPNAQARGELAPAAYPILQEKRLRAILGPVRGSSAYGIIREACSFYSYQITQGKLLHELIAPFQGFSVGTVRTARGFSAQHLITAAVQSISALGTVDEILEESDAADGSSTATTRDFVKKVRTQFSQGDRDRRNRFYRTLSVGGLKDAKVDYAFERTLAQFASLPSRDRQIENTKREAESKLLELSIIQQELQGPSKPLLIVNRQPLQLATEAMKKRAMESEEMFLWLAKRMNIDQIAVATPDEAARALDAHFNG